MIYTREEIAVALPQIRARELASRFWRRVWWTTFSAVVMALALHDMLGIVGKWAAAWLIVNGWMP